MSGVNAHVGCVNTLNRLTFVFLRGINGRMDAKHTRDFLKRAKGYAKRKRMSLRSLSKRLFNTNPYALERLEEALNDGSGGPAHVHVLTAMQLLDDLEEEKERVLA